MVGPEDQVAAHMVEDSFKHDSASTTDRMLDVWEAPQPDLPLPLIKDGNVDFGRDSSVAEVATAAQCFGVLPQLPPSMSMPQTRAVTGHTPGHISQVAATHSYPASKKVSCFADAGMELEEVQNSAQAQRRYSPDLEHDTSMEDLIASIATHSPPSNQTDYPEQIGPPTKKSRKVNFQAIGHNTSGTCKVEDTPQHVKTAAMPNTRRSFRLPG